MTPVIQEPPVWDALRSKANVPATRRHYTWHSFGWGIFTGLLIKKKQRTAEI